ncbi:MAG: protein kinase [Rubrivivax sp.]|nr:protein kinase [Rubrivivax sp.]
MSDHTVRLQGDNPSALPPGTRLGEFEVLSLLGVGGFGIVYLAFDHALEREVAVKEYMPASLAGRTETLHVSVRSQSDADTFALGLRSFVNEARLLARFDHPSLLKVHRFWEANGTAYMAMPVMRGRTVKEVRAQMTQPPGEAWLRGLLTPLLGAIEKLHSEGVFHRDIAPDNIQIEPDGHPVLLDFGAARRVISDKSQALTAILKPAYAPIEQYGENGSVRQGPWTDIYALGATLHYLLLNRPPPPATARAMHDEPSALSTDACPGCSENFLHCIEWMLAPRPADRPQSVAALREVLDGHANPPRRRQDAAPPPSQWDRTVVLGPTVTLPMPPQGEGTGIDFDVDDDATRVLPRPAAAVAPVAMTPPTQTPVPVPVAAAPVAAPNPAPQGQATPPAAPPAHADFSAPPVSAMQAAASQPSAGRPKWLALVTAAAVVAVAAVGFALWPRAPAPSGADATPVAASAPVSAASVAVASEPVVAPPPASTVPESAVATVVVPSAPAPRPAQPVATPPRPAPTAENTQPAGKPPVGARTPAAMATGTATHPPVTAPAQATVPETVRPAAPAPVLPAPATTSAPADATKPAAVAGPESKCGTRNPVSYFFCMERECLRTEFRSHPDCQKWRAEARREPRN